MTNDKNEICKCGHHTKDHSYIPEKDDANLYCELCDCENFTPQSPDDKIILTDGEEGVGMGYNPQSPDDNYTSEEVGITRNNQSPESNSLSCGSGSPSESPSGDNHSPKETEAYNGDSQHVNCNVKPMRTDNMDKTIPAGSNPSPADTDIHPIIASATLGNEGDKTPSDDDTFKLRKRKSSEVKHE